MDAISFNTVIGIGGMVIVLAAVEFTKKIFPNAPQRVYPLYSLFWSMLLNVGVAVYTKGDIGLAVVVGFVVSLMASGFYSGGRTLLRV
jgi:hypothetical protein